ncbi:MAG: dephospho-CoA kinase [Candidatus Baltobacteraceae bacterium]|jgi:dephospho-CoA kinase
MRVGLTGGIGAGKSAVAQTFAELGALVIDADELARLAVAPGSEGLAALAARWPQVLRADGTLDRAALAARVFADARELSELNAIVHPLVRRLSEERESAAAPDRIVVHEVPLLFETGLYRSCQANVLVVAPLETRIGRVVARSGLGRAEVERRARAQIEPARARELADYLIENDGTLAELRERAAAVYRALETRAETR